jgi:hypothetical protein
MELLLLRLQVLLVVLLVARVVLVVELYLHFALCEKMNLVVVHKDLFVLQNQLNADRQALIHQVGVVSFRVFLQV